MIVTIEIELEPKELQHSNSVLDQLRSAVNRESARLFADNWLTTVSLATAQRREEWDR